MSDEHVPAAGRLTDTSDEPRTPASSLCVNFRADGAMLLELLADWRTVLGIAETHVEDMKGAAKVLTSWATGAIAEERSRCVTDPGIPRFGLTVRRDYAQGFATSLVGVSHGGAYVMNSSFDGQLFEEMYGSRRLTDHGSLGRFTESMTRAMDRVFRRQRAKARQRLAGGAYLAVLRYHLEQLREMHPDQSSYGAVKHTLVAIFEDERYLHLAEDRRARTLMAEIDDWLSVLYGQYMDLERGGQVGIRPAPARRS